MKTGRYEHKYRITRSQYHSLLNGIRPHCRRDTHCLDDGGYFVRSLYFDSHNYIFCQQKQAGNYFRVKPRIRIYSLNPDEKSPVSIELKSRRGHQIHKFADITTTDTLKNFLRTRHWNLDDSQVAMEFERLCFLKDLQPKILVDYEREAFFLTRQPDIRITFDHNVRAIPNQDIYTQTTMMKKLYTGIILEIKTPGHFPTWLKHLITSSRARVMPNSKYADGVMLTAYDVVS